MESHPKVQLFIQQGKQDADFVPRQRSDLIESDIEVAGNLFMLKKGHWKQRWLVLRHGLLYKYVSRATSPPELIHSVTATLRYMHPKEKHPYGFYDLRDARASHLDLQRLGDSSAAGKRATLTDSRSSLESGILTHSFSIEVNEKGGKTKKTLVVAAPTEEVLLKWIARINKDKDFQDEDAEFRKVFGVPLQQVRDRDSHGVPLFLSALINYLHATALDDVELFTRAPDEEVKRNIDRGGLTDIGQLARDVHKVAGLVLQYLQELPDALVPSDLQDCFYAMFKVEDPTKRHQLIMALADVLPRVNRAMLVKLFSFLHAAAFDAAETNDGLALPRLSKIFGRLIFRPRPEGPSADAIVQIVAEMIRYPGLLVEVAQPELLEEDDLDSEFSESDNEPIVVRKKIKASKSSQRLQGEGKPKKSGDRKPKEKKKGKKKSKKSKSKRKLKVVSASPSSSDLAVSETLSTTEADSGNNTARSSATGATGSDSEIASTAGKTATADSADENAGGEVSAVHVNRDADDDEDDDDDENSEGSDDEEDAEDSDGEETPGSASEADEPSRSRPSRPAAPPNVQLRARAWSNRAPEVPNDGSQDETQDTAPEATSISAEALAEPPASTGGAVVDLASLSPEKRAAVEEILAGNASSVSLLLSATRNRPKPMRTTRVTSSAVRVPRAPDEPAPSPLTPKQQLMLDLNRVLRSSSAPARPK